VLATGELLEDTPLTDIQSRLLTTMHRSGRQLLSLVEGILDFSRIEAGQVDLHQTRFDPHALVTEVAEAHLLGAERQGVGLDWDIDPRVPHAVVGDRARIGQVLDNLIVNAVKFTQEGRVHLSVCPVDGETGTTAHQLQFSVADTGIGIGQEDQALIFESFRQVDGSVTRRYQGSGLGLAICKELTELMGGTIAVRSAPGVGSTFTVRLPLSCPAADKSQRWGEADA
jgi:signal transduction histidine kinase